MFWENYLSLCSQKGTSPNAVAAELGKSSGSVTAWKGGTVPRETTLKQIADYFSVTVDQLLYEQKEKSPAPEGAELTEAQQMALDLIKSMNEAQLKAFIAGAKSMLGLEV